MNELRNNYQACLTDLSNIPSNNGAESRSLKLITLYFASQEHFYFN